MKFTKSIISMAMLVIAVIFTGCSEDTYWDKYTEPGEKYSFATSSQSIKLGASDVLTEVPVTVFRNTTKGAATLPITATFSEGLSGASEVTFADGSNSAEYIISVGELQMGETYEAALAMDSLQLSVSGNAAFELTLSKDYTWNQVAVGAYTYSLYWNGTKSKMPLYKAAELPGYYKITSTAGGGDLFFTYDSTTGEVWVMESNTGASYSSYGSIYVCDFGLYTGAEASSSSYADGVFTFGVIYYVSAGYLAYGEETFTITAGSVE